MARDVTIYHGDNRRVLRMLKAQGVRFDSVVTDPPYGLKSIVKRFGGKGSAAAQHGKDGAFNRLSRGFQGKTWDGTAIERDPDLWRQVFEVLKPGGYCFAFSSARTGHHQAVAMEQAGFVMHQMHVWLYGTGQPKPKPLQGDWEGWAYSTAAQKPALEPIYLAQRPFEAKLSGPANIEKHGVGAVNIAGCRVGERYPTNVLTDGSPGVVPAHVADIFHKFPLTSDDYELAISSGLIAPTDGKPGVYQAKASDKDRRGSPHPTVKPVALMQYLVRHITPKGGHVLDLFAGTGTTAVAAKREGMDCTLIELDPDYAAFLESRFGKEARKEPRQRIRQRA